MINIKLKIFKSSCEVVQPNVLYNDNTSPEMMKSLCTRSTPNGPLNIGGENNMCQIKMIINLTLDII